MEHLVAHTKFSEKCHIYRPFKVFLSAALLKPHKYWSIKRYYEKDILIKLPFKMAFQQIIQELNFFLFFLVWKQKCLANWVPHWKLFISSWRSCITLSIHTKDFFEHELWAKRHWTRLKWDFTYTWTRLKWDFMFEDHIDSQNLVNHA